jgi:hypothetical protein
VFDEQQYVIQHVASDARARHVALERERVRVGHHTQVDYEEITHAQDALTVRR